LMGATQTKAQLQHLQNRGKWSSKTSWRCK
jgi:hypothetical protein